MTVSIICSCTRFDDVRHEHSELRSESFRQMVLDIHQVQALAAQFYLIVFPAKEEAGPVGIESHQVACLIQSLPGR